MKASRSFSPSNAALLAAVLLAGCKTTGGGSTTVPVTPMCTIQAVNLADNPRADVALVSERTNPNVDHGFTPFRGLSFSSPRGNPSIGFTPDVYGLSEAWLRNPTAPQVFRAQAHPARRGNTGDFQASAWSIHVQNSSGTWSSAIAVGSANRGDEIDTPEVGGETVPQLMPVGIFTPQMFACAGARTQDNALRSTWLLEVNAPGNPAGAQPGVMFIQDLLNGDERFVPNAPGPLRGPANPPTPRVAVPGDPVRSGAVQCAMAQREDDASTRELHMLAIDNGVLYHSMASDFGSVASGPGSSFNRFRNVSRWSNVAQTLGRNVGRIISASVVAARPRAVSVFFIAEQNGIYRLWHTVRFSDTGAWRQPDDVMALSGDAPNGSVYEYKVAAGSCPKSGASYWTDQETEQLIALWGGPNKYDVYVIRVTPNAQDWTPSVRGIYSPLRHVDSLSHTSQAEERNTRIPSVRVIARPFSDDAKPLSQ